MSQELTYTVRFKPHEGDLRDIESSVGKAEKQRPRRQQATGDPRELERYQSQLDQLTNSYLKNAKSLSTLQKEIGNYRSQLRDLSNVEKEQGHLSEEQTRQQVAIKTALKDTQSEYNKTTREMIAQQQATEATGDSYDDMRIRMKQLSVEIRNTQDPLGKNKEAVSAMTTEYNSLNDRLKEIDASMGNHQRNVGNYENSIRAAANAVAVFQGPLGPLAGRMNSFATVLTRATEGSRNMTRATIALRVAKLALFGVFGLVIAAFASVMRYFRGTERGAQQLRVITAGLSAAMAVLTDRAIAMGEAIVDAVRNPRESYQRLSDATVRLSNLIVEALVTRMRNVGSFYGGLLSNITARFRLMSADIRLALADTPVIGNFINTEKAEKDADDAFRAIVQSAIDTHNALEKVMDFEGLEGMARGVGEAFSEFANNIREAVREGTALQRLENQLIQAERALIVARAEQNKELQNARALARELTADHQERIEALKAVEAAEQSLLNQELEVAQQRLQVHQARMAMAETTEEELLKEAELQAEVANLEAESAKRAISLLRDVTAVERQERELRQRIRRRESNTQLGLMQLQNEEEIEMLRRQNRHYEAALLERTQIGFDEETRYNEIYQDLIDQRVDSEIASELAKNQVLMELERERFEADKKIYEERKALVDEITDAQIAAVTAGLNLAFNENKQAQIANTIIETARGVQKAINDNPPAIGIPLAASIAFSGAQTVRKIASTQIGSTQSPTAPQIDAPSESFQFVDVPSFGEEIASQDAPSQNRQPVIILEGEFDPEFLSVKVRQGNDTISGNTIAI